MPNKLLVRVYPKSEGAEYGPDLAMIEHAPQAGIIDLREAIALTQEFATRINFASHPPSSDVLLSAELRLGCTPLKVTWLRSSVLYDNDGNEPSFLDEFEDENRIVLPEDWLPNLGEMEELGRFENEFTAVDLQTLRILADGWLEVEANVDSTAGEFCTDRFEAGMLLGDDRWGTIEVGDSVYVTDPSEPKDNFEGTVDEVAGGGDEPVDYYLVSGGRYSSPQTYLPGQLQLVRKAGE